MSFEFVIEPLDRQHLRQDFDCEEESLNTYLKNFARQNAEKGLGRTFVAIKPPDLGICGYYTLSSGSTSFENVIEKLPRYPVPTVLLGRLALDKNFKGAGLGRLLLVDALKRTVSVSDQLGIFAVEVFALNDEARKFYLKYGFVEFRDQPMRLYIPIKTMSILF